MSDTYPDIVIGYNRNEWKGDLYWTPSQLNKTIIIQLDKPIGLRYTIGYELYLRWRHSDPWEIYINDKYIVLNKDYLAEEYEELMDYIDNNINEIINKYGERNEPK